MLFPLSAPLRAPRVQPIDNLVADLPEHGQLLLFGSPGIRRIRKAPVSSRYSARNGRALLVRGLADRDHPIPMVTDKSHPQLRVVVADVDPNLGHRPDRERVYRPAVATRAHRLEPALADS